MAKVKAKIIDNIYDPNIDKPVEYTFDTFPIIKLQDHEWGTFLDAETIAKMWLSRKLIFFPETQRGLTIKRNKQGKIEERAVSDSKKIGTIQTKIRNGSYSIDTITINLLGDGKDKVEFKDGKLHIEALMCLLDGQHRTKALASIYQSNLIVGGDSKEYKDLKSIIFPIKISNKDKTEASLEFYQYTLNLRISKSLAESFNKKNAINRIVTALNKSGTLENKIDTTKTSISSSNSFHIYTFATLVEAIRNSFGEIEDEEMEKNVLEFLQAFFKELISVFPELIDEELRSLSKQYSLVCENFTAYAFIEIAQLFYFNRYDGTWKNNIQKLRDINFDKMEGEEINKRWRSFLQPTENGAKIVNNKSTRQSFRRAIKEEYFKLK